MEDNIRPLAPIRRFDIFAEWNRLLAAERHHLDADDARAYGIAVAKVVAARKLHGHEPARVGDYRRRAREHDLSEAWWEHMGSSEEFERKVIARMGDAFYREVLRPAVRDAWDAGKDYEDIRDSLRAEWSPAARPRRARAA